MRNFSYVGHTHFQSYQINVGEYVSQVDIGEVLTALAKAFESPVSIVRESFNAIIRGNMDDVRVCPAEGRVLLDLYSQYALVQRHKCDFWGAYKHGTQTFVYHNLNTGVSVIWVHFVG